MDVEMQSFAMAGSSPNLLLISSLLEGSWTRIATERRSLARALIGLKSSENAHGCRVNAADEAPAWLVDGVGRALGSLEQLATEALEQAKGQRWRAGLLGSCAPQAKSGTMSDFESCALVELRSRMSSLLDFAERWEGECEADVQALLPPDLRENAEDAAKTWVVLSCAIVASADRSYRGEGDVQMIEKWLFGGGFRGMPPTTWSSGPSSAHQLLLEARDTEEEEMYDAFERFVWARERAGKLVATGVLRREEVDLILALGPADGRS
jgi:hypothetical protein